ncbi:MAG: hypothetical protein ACE5R6_10195 [Candidatus Heimdallarchaeota archaeon]
MVERQQITGCTAQENLYHPSQYTRFKSPSERRRSGSLNLNVDGGDPSLTEDEREYRILLQNTKFGQLRRLIAD